MASYRTGFRGSSESSGLLCCLFLIVVFYYRWFSPSNTVSVILLAIDIKYQIIWGGGRLGFITNVIIRSRRLEISDWPPGPVPTSGMMAVLVAP